MHEDSPPPFIVIRTPAPPQLDAYDRALALVGVVQGLLERAQARFYLKDRLDRAMTSLVFELSRARHAVKPTRWRHHRRAHELACDCATILDILRHQNAANVDDLQRAQQMLHDLLADLGRLG